MKIRQSRRLRVVWFLLVLVVVTLVYVVVGLCAASRSFGEREEVPYFLKSKSMERGKVVLLGDSLTQLGFGDGGFASELSHYYQRRLDVLNRGYAGYNSRWLLDLMREGYDNREVRLAIIFLGANDAALPGERQHVPVDEYKKNLRHIVKIVEKSKIILICPPPIDQSQRLAYQRERYGDKATGILERTLETTGTYAEACAALADELNIPCVNIYDSMQATSNWPTFLSDGLHLSKEGNQFLAKELIKAIETHLPELAVAPCPKTQNFGSSGSTSRLLPDAPWHDTIHI